MRVIRWALIALVGWLLLSALLPRPSTMPHPDRQARQQDDPFDEDAMRAADQAERAERLVERQAEVAACARLVRQMLPAEIEPRVLVVVGRDNCGLGCPLLDAAQQAIEASSIGELRGVWVSHSGVSADYAAHITQSRPGMQGMVLDECKPMNDWYREEFFLMSDRGGVLQAGSVAYRLRPEWKPGEDQDAALILRRAVEGRL